MKKIYLLNLLFLIGCSTYVPVSYRQTSDFVSPKGAPIKIAFDEKFQSTHAEKGAFLDSLEKDIKADDWWITASKENEKKAYTLTIESVTYSSLEDSSKIEEVEKKRTRTASYTTTGNIIYFLKPSKGEAKSYNATASGTSSSSAEIPAPADMNKFFPAMTAMLGISNEQQAIQNHNRQLESSSLEQFRQNMSKAVMEKITPKLVTVKIEFDDEEDDMETATDFINKKDYESAYHYLKDKLEKDPRADVLYNYGVILEAKGMHTEACGYYAQAMSKKDKKLYSKQKAECETRKGHYTRVLNAKN